MNKFFFALICASLSGCIPDEWHYRGKAVMACQDACDAVDARHTHGTLDEQGRCLATCYDRCVNAAGHLPE